MPVGMYPSPMDLAFTPEIALAPHRLLRCTS